MTTTGLSAGRSEIRIPGPGKCCPKRIAVDVRLVVVDVTTVKMARKTVELQRIIQQDALGKVNRVKEIRRREKDGLKITDKSIM